jgi:hypothetical protein
MFSGFNKWEGENQKGNGKIDSVDNEEEQQAKITIDFASLKLLDDPEDDSSRFRWFWQA